MASDWPCTFFIARLFLFSTFITRSITQFINLLLLGETEEPEELEPSVISVRAVHVVTKYNKVLSYNYIAMNYLSISYNH